MKWILNDAWVKFKVGMGMFWEAMSYHVKKYWVLWMLAAIGLLCTGTLADIYVVSKVIGVISAFLLICGMALDDREGKGLFPSYDEDKLMKIIESSPVASAIVIVGKNLLVAIILILAVMFIRP